MSNNIQMGIVAMAARIKDFAKQKLNMTDIDKSWWKKLLLIFGIVFFSFATYLNFIPKYLNIPREVISLEQPPLPSIAGFYHFAAMTAHWKDIVYEQMLLAHRTGLIEVSSIVYVTGLGSIGENKTIYDIFANSKFIYEYHTRTDLYEYPTLIKIEKYCLDHNESLVWYAHSKGSSRPDDVSAWRHMMNHYVLDEWQLCYGLLSSTNYTTCGSILTFDAGHKPGWNTFYAGNMWWAKCSHVNRLTRIEKLDLHSRYNAELWVTSEPAVGHFNCQYVDFRAHWELNKETASCTVNQPTWRIRR